VVHVIHMGEVRSILVGKPEGRRSLGDGNVGMSHK
jgi:hypothetical protein